FAQKAGLNGENIETLATELPEDAELRIFQAVPEPATPVLLAAGVCMLQVLARRSRRAGKPRPLH
ncbi:MAG: PEP-CTERM sorting domain-containing protein, partial [Myxococcota bacterium]